MRADYVDRFRDDWTGGLKRLLADGAWFSNAAYPYLGTYTCPGHATVSTGAFPHLHGIMQNTWWDRTTRRTIACTDDDSVTTLRYPGGTEPGASAARLLLPALADQLRAERAGTRVVTVALKARSAIMLAGHGAGAVTWMDDAYDHWETSTAFTAFQPFRRCWPPIPSTPISDAPGTGVCRWNATRRRTMAMANRRRAVGRRHSRTS